MFSEELLKFNYEITGKLVASVKNTKAYSDLLNLLERETSFLPIDSKIGQRLWHLRNNVCYLPVCKICGAPVKYRGSITNGCNGYTNTCSRKCGSQFNSQNVLSKYGVVNYTQTDEYKEKTIATNNLKYGSDYYTQSNEYKEKCKNRSNSIPVKHHLLTDSSYARLSNKRYLYWLHHTRKYSCQAIGAIVGVCGATVLKYLRMHNISLITGSSSSYERIITDYLDSLGIEYVTNTKKIISPYELDIYIPSLKIGIEIDGLYWHSFDKKGSQYHLNKTKLCNDLDIRLIHIFENEIYENLELVQSRIANALFKNTHKIYARKCVIKEVSSGDSRDFLNKNHIQGYVFSKIRIGLYHDDNLVSLMTFGSPRFNKRYEYELIRFCNLSYVSVVGGASRLYKSFLREYNPVSVISYSDIRWNTGNLYERLGMVHLRDSAPNYWYFKKDAGIFKLFNRVKFQKHKLKNMLIEYNENDTEWENMRMNGYNKIYDCGNMVYGINYD